MNTSTATPPHPSSRFRARTVWRWTGRALVLVWAAFWTWFNLASLVGEMAELGIGAWINHGLFAALIVALTVLVFRRPLWGGIGLLVLTAGMAVLFRRADPDVWATLLLPPAAGGILAIATRPTSEMGQAQN